MGPSLKNESFLLEMSLPALQEAGRREQKQSRRAEGKRPGTEQVQLVLCSMSQSYPRPSCPLVPELILLFSLSYLKLISITLTKNS